MCQKGNSQTKVPRVTPYDEDLCALCHAIRQKLKCPATHHSTERPPMPRVIPYDGRPLYAARHAIRVRNPASHRCFANPVVGRAAHESCSDHHHSIPFLRHHHHKQTQLIDPSLRLFIIYSPHRHDTPLRFRGCIPITIALLHTTIAPASSSSASAL